MLSELRTAVELGVKTTDDRLKPCPLCGSGANMAKKDIRSGNLSKDGLPASPKNSRSLSLACVDGDYESCRVGWRWRMRRPCDNCVHDSRWPSKYPCNKCHVFNYYKFFHDGTQATTDLVEIIKRKDLALEEANKRIADIEERVNKLAARIGEGGYRQECVMDFAPFKDLHISRAYVPGHIILKMGNAIKDVDIYDLINKSGEKN